MNRHRKRTIKVSQLARVEGEGSLEIQTEGLALQDLKLSIFEPPRFFEAFLRGRSHTEAPDITARICGICPVAYQMSTVHAIEAAFNVEVSREIDLLRRLLYCGEWIESHVLHMVMLHAPDFLKLHSAVEVARDHRNEVEAALQIKQAGNAIIRILGGREVHPINVCVGGFFSLPKTNDLKELLTPLEEAYEKADKLLEWVSSFSFPEASGVFKNGKPPLVSLVHEHEYPMNHGLVCLSNTRASRFPVTEYEDHFVEQHLAHSTALHSRLMVRNASGKSVEEPYLTGPLARLWNNHQHLPQKIKKKMQSVGFQISPINPFRSLQARGVEVLFALHEAIQIVKGYHDGFAPKVDFKPLASQGFSATEAPRGLLYHHFELDTDGLISKAKIIPPTSQNQGFIEEDLRYLVTENLDLEDDELRHLCEQAIRNYDPCISCASHFLKFTRKRKKKEKTKTLPLVIALGNPYRQDDAAGPAVLNKLRKKGMEKSAELIHFQGDALGLIAHWKGRDTILIDAVMTDASENEGQVTCTEWNHTFSQSVEKRGSFTSHLPNLSDVFRVSQQLNKTPQRLMIVGISARHFEYGEKMSRPVLKALNEAELVVQTTLEEMNHA